MVVRTKVLVVLDTMWGDPGKAPGVFRINPDNFTGSRLYRLICHEDFWVTNVCREQVSHAALHGQPDPKWLVRNLRRLDYDLLLVCGRVAQRTYRRCGYVPSSRVLEIPHPAARNWTNSKLDETSNLIRGE